MHSEMGLRGEGMESRTPSTLDVQRVGALKAEMARIPHTCSREITVSLANMIASGSRSTAS